MNSPHLINLLSKTTVRAFSRDYRYRLATASVLGLILIVIINILLLAPAYLYAHAHVVTLQSTLATLDQTMKSGDQNQVATRIADLTKEQVYLMQLQQSTKAPALLDAVLAVPRPGIALTSFHVSPPVQRSGTIVINGTAETREALRAFVTSLGTLPFVSNVDLPISAYASESNIHFTITLTGSLTI